eukprot:gene4357-7713_t
MECISQFFILSLRGDKIIYKDFRSDISGGVEEIFFRRSKSSKGDLVPCFNEKGVNFIHLKRQNMYFVCTTRYNISGLLVLEYLERLCVVLRDFIGVESEQSYRKNFLLIYEILDEIADYGYIQNTMGLKYFVINEPNEDLSYDSIFTLPVNTVINNLRNKTKSSLSVSRSVHSKNNSKNEVFVDVLETVHCLFSNGSIVRAEVVGTVVMKSYLLGQPTLSFALNENLVIGRQNSYESTYGGLCILDSCNFSEICQLNEFSNQKVINLCPPEGEFTLMNYRITAPYNMPFRIETYLDYASKYKLEMSIKLTSTYPKATVASKVQVLIPVPKVTNTISVDHDKAKTSVEYDSTEKTALWEITAFPGEEVIECKISISLTNPIIGDFKKSCGPISMKFELPAMNVSDFQIKYLKVRERSKSYSPSSWIRYITLAGDYCSRF